MSSMHPLGFVELVTKHKLIGAIIALAVVVFLVSIVKIISALRSDKEKEHRQD
jgi:hypothetical protein